jgi:PAS domain S-box-containing protein
MNPSPVTNTPALQPAEEIKRLQSCISDLVSVLALPTAWAGSEPSHIARTLLDSLLRMLGLDLMYVQLKEAVTDAPVEMVRIVGSGALPEDPKAVGELISRWLGDDPRQWLRPVRCPLEAGMLSLVPLRLGLHGEMGMMVAGSWRADFPGQTDKLLLSVAANQAAIGLQEARLLAEQKRVAGELDHRVAERTRELAAANEELRRSEARKDAILSSALDCIVTIDHEGCITEFNPAAERTFGYRRDAVLGRQLADVIVPPSLREQHHRGFARYLTTGEARVLGRRIEMTAIRADGSEFPVELAITRIPMDGPPSFTGYLRDITERKRWEEELRRSEASLMEAQRLSSTGTFSWRVATDDIAWSEQTYRIFELDPAVPVTFDLLGSRLHPEDIPSFQQMLDRQRDEGDDFEHEHRLLLPDRSVKYLHVVAHATRDEEEQLKYIGWVQDVTERRLAEAALGKARADLAHVARVTSLGALTASIAHEVNQPLSGIITNAGTCLRMLAADPPNVDGARETARRMIRDGHRATEVITRLRALFSRRKAALEAVDLNEATREVIALSLTELHRNRVVLRSELADDLPPVMGDRVQLQQVILNLLLNASDAMSGVTDRPRELVIRTEPDERDGVRLSIQDAGAGLEPLEMDRLFEPFYTTKSGGMGIGLSVSRSIIESHNGRLWAVPNDGPGATFAFSIPGGAGAES